MITGADVLALIGGFLGSVCSVPQIILMFRSGSAKDISALFTLLYFISIALQATYMTLISAWAGAIALWIETALAFLFFTGKIYFLLLEIKHKKGQEKNTQDSEIIMEVSLDLNELAKNISNTLLISLTQHPSSKVQLQTSSSSAKALADILYSNSVSDGKFSMGTDFCLTAQYHLRKNSTNSLQTMSNLRGDDKRLLLPECLHCHARNSLLDIDIGAVMSEIYQCQMVFPRADCFFPIRGIPNPLLIKALAAMGCNFDCVSFQDIFLVRDITWDLPSPYNSPEILYANINYESHTDVVDAVCLGINYALFDNMTALKLYASITKEIKLVLRINIDFSGLQCKASCKSGAPKHTWRSLLNAARKYGLEVVGVALHTGSRLPCINHYKKALNDSRDLFDLGESEFGFKMKFLDIGNVFDFEPTPVKMKEWFKARQGSVHHSSAVPLRHYEENSEEIVKKNTKMGFRKGRLNSHFSDVIMPTLDNLFPEESGIKIVTKPGKYHAAAPCSKINSIVRIQQTMASRKHPPAKILDAAAVMHVHTKFSTKEDKDLVTAGKNKYDMPFGCHICLVDDEGDGISSYHSCESMQ